MLCSCCHHDNATYEVSIVVNGNEENKLSLCYDCFIFFDYRTRVLYGLFARIFGRKKRCPHIV